MNAYTRIDSWLQPKLKTIYEEFQNIAYFTRYLHDFSQNCSADEDHVLPLGRILDPDLKFGQPLCITLE